MLDDKYSAGTPWKRGIGEDCHKIHDNVGRLVGTIESPNDGTFIVNACNSHADLLKALTVLVKTLDGERGPHNTIHINVILDRAKAAIAKATE